VLGERSEFARWKIDRRNALRLAPTARRSRTLTQRLEKMRTASTDALGPAPVMAAAAQSPELSAAPQAATHRRRRRQSANNNGSQSRDFHFGGGGGGAIDPISGSIVSDLAHSR
jgi:hypothetical protein